MNPDHPDAPPPSVDPAAETDSMKSPRLAAAATRALSTTRRIVLAGAAVGVTFPLLGAPARFPGADWEIVAPEAVGVDAARLKAAVDYLDATWGRDGARELFLVRHGRALWVGPDADASHTIFSCTKTFTSAVLGLLVDDGKCALDDLAVKHRPELDDQHPLYGRIRLRHLASMCGGYRGEVVDKRPDQPWGDVMKYLNPREPYFEAGTHVQYNDHDVFVLGRILTGLAGEPLRDVFQRRIAGPIGIRDWAWGVSGTIDGIALNNPPGNPGGSGAGGVKISPRELARFGLLMLNRGNWNGRQLLSAAFVDEATSNRVPLTGGFRNRDFRGRYGFYWWTNGEMVNGRRPWPSAPPRTYMSHGNGGNFCCVVPEWDLVIVRTGAPVRDADRAWDGFFARLAPALAPVGAAVAAPRHSPPAPAAAAQPPSVPSGGTAPPAPPRDAPHRIGDWTINRWAGLDVVGDPRGHAMHLVFRDEMTLFYVRSDDEGWTWSRPESIVNSGLHPRLALDSAGTLHLVYCSARGKHPGDRLPNDGWYQTRRAGRWSSPEKLNQPSEGALDVRVAVDGNDNVHVLYWAPGTESREMGEHERHRCWYRRKPAGASAFEPALCFENSAAPGASSHGAIAVGPQGEIHLLYRTFQTAPSWLGNLEHRIRNQDGSWRGEPAVYRGTFWADHSLAAAVDLRGTLYVAGYTFRPHGFRFKVYQRPAGVDALQEVFSEADTYGTSSGIVASPEGGVWAVGSGNWSTRSRPGTPRSSWYYRDAAAAAWTQGFLSPAEAANVDVFCEGPRLLWHRGRVQAFYPERGADGKFRLYQRILTPPRPGDRAQP